MRRLVCVLSLFPLIYGCSSTPAPKPVVKPQPNSAFINQTPPSKPFYGQVSQPGVSKGDFANRSNVDNFVQRMVQKHGFDGAELPRANLRAAKLSGASFVGANLQGANFTRAQLVNADLTGANLDQAIFLNAQTEGCKGCP